MSVERQNINTISQLELKNKGNESFTQRDYGTAFKFYNDAIKINPDAVEAAAIYSNRSLCYLDIGEAKKALVDAEKCISLKPQWFRGYYRKGAALFSLNQFQEASASFDEALKCEGVDDISSKEISELKQQAELSFQSARRRRKDPRTVFAVRVPADQHHPLVQVQLPYKIVDNAQAVHDLLNITPDQIKSLPEFLRKQPSTVAVSYSMKDWMRDHEEMMSKHGGSLGYGFQPRQLVRDFLPH